MELKHVDNLISNLGKPGKFQLVTFVLLCGNFFVVMTNHMAMVFFGAKTKYHCKTKNINLVPTVTRRNNERQWDGCHLYVGNNTTETIPCSSGWTYHLEDGETTILSEFDLVCKNAYKSDLSTTVYFAGVTLSGLPFGVLADRYGRKPVIGSTLLLAGIVNGGIFIFRKYVVFITLRFLLGFLMQGLQNATLILAMELFSTKYRATVGFVLAVCGRIGALVLDLLYYLIRDWKYVQLALAVLPFIQFFTIGVIPESLRWHLICKNFDQAELIVKRTVTINNLSFPREQFEDVKRQLTNETSSSAPEKKATIYDVFKSPKLRKITLTLIIIWFTASASFYGLTFYISFLYGDKYLNFAVSTVLDIVMSGLMMMWVVPRYGRRKPLILGFFLCAAANIVCIFTTASSNVALKYLGTAVAIFGKTVAAGLLCLIFVFTAELYPTVVRNISLGVNTLWGRLGGMAAPQIFFLGIHTSSYVPYVIVSVLTLTSGFLMWLLSDTHNKALSDRLDKEEFVACIQNIQGNDVRDGEHEDRYYETSI